MKCPRCDKTMKAKNTRTTHNPDNGKKYSKKVYVCATDDIWISVETPKKK